MPILNVRVAPKSGAKQFYRCGIEFTDEAKEVEVDDATATRLLEEQMLEVEVVGAGEAGGATGDTGDNDDDTGNTGGDDGNHADAPADPADPAPAPAAAAKIATAKAKGK